MLPFLVALFHLLQHSLARLVREWMATSIVAVVVGLVGSLGAPWIDALIHREKKLVKRPGISGSLVMGLVTWSLLLPCSLIYTIYADHVRLVSQNDGLRAELATKDTAIHMYAVDVINCANRLKALTREEPSDSLRRRTFRLADEFTAYVAKAQGNKPPDAFPSSSDPNPSEGRKRAIEQSHAYYKAIEDYYFKHFRDRFVGILREYNAKGVRTGNFEIDFDNRVPSVAEQGSFWETMDDLSRFRDLAFHVDAQDHLITF